MPPLVAMRRLPALPADDMLPGRASQESSASLRMPWRPIPIRLVLFVIAGCGLLLASRATRVRDMLRGSAFTRLNIPPLRRIDAALFNLAHELPPPSQLGDGLPAANLVLNDPMGLDRDRAGNLYVSDRGGGITGRMVWRIDPAGIAHAVAGTGRRGIAPEGVALHSSLGSPQSVRVDSRGRLYVADSYNHVVLRIDPSGRLERFAGTGEAGSVGDRGPATAARLNQPYDVHLGADGDVFIADFGNHRVRRVDRNGLISTVAGTGSPGFGGNGGPAPAARLHGPFGVYFDPAWGLLIADSFNHRVRRVDANGVITTVAGTGVRGFTGDGGPAIEATFDSPQGLFVDRAGRLIVCDEHNHSIRMIDRQGTVRTLIGQGVPGWTPDNTPGRGAARATGACAP